jgi:hypothetical protein
MTDYIQVFAIVRIDTRYLERQPELSVKVVKILPTYPEAETEVERLNSLSSDRESTYFVQSTHWFPLDGAAHET